MARYGTRSPSPGSTPKRARRDDDHYDRSRRERDDDRYHRRRRSRSRSPEVRLSDAQKSTGQSQINDTLQRRRHDRDRDRDRERDRDRDRDRDYTKVDRRYDDRYDRHNRRDRSRERRRSRDREDNRLRLSREKDSHLRLERESPDRDRRRRDESTESRKRKRDDSRGPSEVRRPPSSSNGAAYTSQSSKKEDEKAARLKKLEEWKRKQAATSQTSSPKPAASPSTPTTVPGTPTTIPKPSVQSQPVKKLLGADAVIGTPTAPTGSIKKTSTLPSKPKSAITSPAEPSKLLKPKGNLSGFSIGGKAQENEVGKKGLAFEEDDVKMKLERLPTLGLAVDEPQEASAADEDEDADDIEDDENEEEALAAARAAAEQRSRAEQTEDMAMTDAPPAPETIADEMKDEDEEEEDPLDAFMQDLSAKPAKVTSFKAKGINGDASKLKEPESFFNEDDIEKMAAVDEDDPDNIMAKAEEIAKKKKKDIGVVNHSKVDYEPFRRNFYSEPVDMQDWTDEEVASLRMELDNIKVRGVDVPKPVQTWAQCGLGVQVLDCIQSLGYPAPTSIQAQAIPSVMSGRDIIGVAKTGSGKTIAFLLPMFRHIKDQRPLDSLDGPIGLILSPTRELATQIHKECKPFLKALNLRAVCAYGGAPIKDQIADFKRGAEIVVCTPGRMIDLLAANGGRVTNLKRVTYVVLDEADRMFDMGFEPQVMKILANVRPDKQTVLFSATFPRAMEALARKTLAKPVEIIVGGRSVVAPEITQIVEVRPENTKFHRLLELLGKLYEEEANEDDRALIFVDRQESADGLLRDLMKKGYPCMSIHGGKDQIDRDSTIDDFKAGIVPILIATSVAARGLDVKQLKLVVNYDSPNHLEDYVHRAGRTGRAGNTGTAVTFLTEEQDRYAVDIAKALKQSGQPIPEPVQKLVDGFAEKVKAGKEKGYAGGFGGKGLERLDQQRDADKARERKTFKTGDEKEEEEDKDELKPAKVGDEIFAKAASSIGARDQASESSTPVPKQQLPGVPSGIDLDATKITVHKTEKPSSKTNASQMDKVAAAVAGINAKLSKAGVMRSGVPIDNKGPDAGAFHATLEINDFPQRARWAVTNRTNVAKILESTGTSITTKGTFYAAGNRPGPNDLPPLYVLVEGDTELVVQQAMRALLELLKEGTMAAAAGEGARGPGRYSVV